MEKPRQDRQSGSLHATCCEGRGSPGPASTQADTWRTSGFDDRHWRPFQRPLPPSPTAAGDTHIRGTLTFGGRPQRSPAAQPAGLLRPARDRGPDLLRTLSAASGLQGGVALLITFGIRLWLRVVPTGRWSFLRPRPRRNRGQSAGVPSHRDLPQAAGTRAVWALGRPAGSSFV